MLWHVTPGGPLRGAPSIANGQVYVTSQDNQLYALKADDGSPEWDTAATLEIAGVFGAAAPAVAQGTVVAGFSSGELNAYRYENGRAVWGDMLARTGISTSVSTLSDIDAEPVIDEGKVYAVGQGGRMAALDITTGQRLWELNIAGVATPAVAGEWVFVVTDQAKLLCIARSSGKVRWLSELPRWRNEGSGEERPIQWAGPVIAGDRADPGEFGRTNGHYFADRWPSAVGGRSQHADLPVAGGRQQHALHPRRQGPSDRVALG